MIALLVNKSKQLSSQTFIVLASCMERMNYRVHLCLFMQNMIQCLIFFVHAEIYLTSFTLKVKSILYIRYMDRNINLKLGTKRDKRCRRDRQKSKDKFKISSLCLLLKDCCCLLETLLLDRDSLQRGIKIPRSRFTSEKMRRTDRI